MHNEHLGEVNDFIASKVYLVKRACGRFGKYFRGALGYDDFYSAGLIALMKVYNTFDPSKGIPFDHYALRSIIGTMKNLVRDSGSTIKISRQMKEKWTELCKMGVDFDMTAEQIAFEHNLELDYVLDALTYWSTVNTVSMNALLPDSDDTTVGDMIGDGSAEDPDRLIAFNEFKEGLTDKQRSMLELHLAGYSQREIATALHSNQMTVSRTLAKIVEQAELYSGETYKEVAVTMAREVQGDVSAARKLLRETDKSIAEIARETGCVYATVNNWAKKIRGSKPSDVTSRQMTPEERAKYGLPPLEEPPVQPEQEPIPERMDEDEYFEQVTLPNTPERVTYATQPSTGYIETTLIRNGVTIEQAKKDIQSLLDFVATLGGNRFNINIIIDRED